MFLVDTSEKRIVSDEEIKARVAAEKPYLEWVEAQRVHMKDLPPAPATPLADHETLELRQNVFGYTAEVLRLLQPMVETGVRPSDPWARHASRHPFQPTAEPVQLLQTAFRPGDQPAGGCHPGRADHGGRHHHGP